MRQTYLALLVAVGALALPSCRAVPPDCQPPVAAFRASPEGGELPILVVLDASDSHARTGTIVSYEWDFGDGTSATGRTARHRFNEVETGPEQQSFRVTLTVTQMASPGDISCAPVDSQASTERSLTYGISYPLNVTRWEIKDIYYGTMIEGHVTVSVADVRVTHGQVLARFYRGPDHELVGEAAEAEVWNLRPGEERLFMITTTLRRWQFDWVELRTMAFTEPL